MNKDAANVTFQRVSLTFSEANVLPVYLVTQGLGERYDSLLSDTVSSISHIIKHDESFHRLPVAFKQCFQLILGSSKI